MANQRIKLSPWIVIQMLFFHRRHPVSAAFNLLGLELVGSLVYAIIAILGFVISRVLAARRHPDLIAERARFMQHENTKSWENRLAPLVGFSGGLILLVCGLDAQFGWSPPFSLPVKKPWRWSLC